MPNIQCLQIYIGRRLKELRRQKNITMEVLTGLLDMDFSNYVYLEKGGGKGIPRLDTLFKITEFYGVPVDYLFQDYKLAEEKLLKTNLLEQKLLKVFRKMEPETQLLCLRFLNKLTSREKK
jgi:transcriptional regulator with XRE-family HTH domain